MSNSPEKPTDRIRRLLAQRLESLANAGVEQLPRLDALPLSESIDLAANSEPVVQHEVQPASTQAASTQATPPQPVSTSPAPSVSPEPQPATPVTTEATPPAAARPDSLDDSQRLHELTVLQSEVANCTKCPELVTSRTQTVFGVGAIRPRLCFFGEAPGRDEDQQGEPFVGAAGQLLNKIIEAMTLRREDVYILNVLKCRPPNNRNPEPNEIACCEGYYQRQLEILQPEFICCLGAFAAKTLLKTDLSVGRMRNRFYDVHHAKAMVTYHPAYLLRNPSAKKSTWDDIKMLMAEMGLKRS